MNQKTGRIYIYIIVFIITAALYSCLLYMHIGKLEFKPAPQEYEMDIEKTVINYGDSLDSSMASTRLSNDDKSEIKKELGKAGCNIGRINAGDFFEIVYSTTSGRWTNFWYYTAGEHFYSLKKLDDGSFESSKKYLAINKAEHTDSGAIKSSLWEAMESAGVPANMIMSFADIFAWQIDFLTDTREGDTFKIIYEIQTIGKTNKKLSSNIIAAQYKSGKSEYNAILFKTSDGNSGYFDEEGKSVRSAFLKAPLQFRRISSYFTATRKHPILKRVRPHLGIDYAAPAGTPVSAIGDGTITKSQWSGGFGNYVEIRHSNGYVSSYGHLLKYGRGIKRGVRVKQGQIIGTVGSTGLSTGPHLDFRIKKDGRFFNFLTMKQPPTTTLTGNNRETFNAYKTEIMQKLIFNTASEDTPE